MRILYVDLSPSWGGSLASLERLLTRLDRQAYQPQLLLAAQNRAAAVFRDRGLPVYTVPTFRAEAARNTALVRQVKATPVGQRLRTGRLAPLWGMTRGVRSTILRTWPLTARLWRIVAALWPDLVHINDAIFVNRPAIAAAWLARVPAICHVRSLGQLSGWDRLWARTLSGLVFISQWVAQDQAVQGIPTERGRVIYDGLDLTCYARVPDRAEARAMLGWPLDRPIVLALGRLVPWKGQDLFLRALRRVADVRPDVLGVVAGAPEPYSLDFEPALHALADELHLTDAVRFVGQVADPTAALAAADVVAHTSVAPEPFGLVMLEAMAVGRPVVTPAAGGGLEIVTHGETGLHYTPGDEAALARALLTLLDDVAQAERMGAAGRERVAARFTLDQFVGEMSRFYQDLLAVG